jgi:predicted Zn-dependent protease
MAPRVVVLIATAVVVVWLAAGLRAARLAVDGRAVAMAPAGPLAPGRVDEALDRLRRAADTTPDKDPDADRARLLDRLGREAEAIAILRGLTRAQPENAAYWAALGAAASTRRPRLAAEARARLRELAPPVPPP